MSERVRTIALLVACVALTALGGYLAGRGGGAPMLIGWCWLIFGTVGTLIGASATYHLGRSDAMGDALRMVERER